MKRYLQKPLHLFCRDRHSVFYHGTAFMTNVCIRLPLIGLFVHGFFKILRWTILFRLSRPYFTFMVQLRSGMLFLFFIKMFIYCFALHLSQSSSYLNFCSSAFEHLFSLQEKDHCF